ncbi:Histidine kinase-, DNA gyrase B-, and HSP90-like ATPase [Rhodoblastus acidophilus]|uniref:Histidine kinase-, DNA gyrase B-, and HSP90-like ATPase n=1 Tax=Rhodoblastus acidophilus TaxID=1074 RepID=A0A212SHX7_RHOAC|nr:ATP-binding protein [Rhodoblastus acidophilus]PPQ34614.1 hypothetical protein CKO16_22305 [Rhodoblastus acidophilus]RAI16280.1 hypothetical protein CH337_22215 [Rhodoblastus acidophilus]SNB85341.1 Histidine kinase-, DNA gyrase B-, and HSP90-like ATPase [Rhodoblastus acidophilus]
MTILKLHAKQDHLEKVARTRDPIKAISEFVWNSLDAEATNVFVDFKRNALAGIEEIVIRDDGVGINQMHAASDFANLGDSWKRSQGRTPNLERALHGKEGRGRLRFFSLAHTANWSSVYDVNGSKFQIQLTILATSLDKCEITQPAPIADTATGVTVSLYPLKEVFDWLASSEARNEFCAIFAPYLMQYPNVSLYYDSDKLNPSTTIEVAHDFAELTVNGPNRKIESIGLKVIEWKSAIEKRQIHLGGADGIVLGSQSANVAAPGFYFSAYANSAFFEEMAEANLLELDNLSDPDFMAVLADIREKLSNYFRKRQAERARGLIDDLKTEGVYPYEGEPRDEVERRERDVFDIATYAVSSYSRDFKRSEVAMKKITLTLLREALRHNPEELTNILRAIVNLPKNKQKEFSTLLSKTSLSNIISASSLVADRVTTLTLLRAMVFDEARRRTVKERGELDVIVRDNTWLFGERFHITMAEAGLTKIMERVLDDMHAKRTRGKGTQVRQSGGKIGRIDCFLGRSIPLPDKMQREYIVVELKRPSKTIGKKELDQIEEYKNALIAQSDFNNTVTQWNFVLVTGDYDGVVKHRVTQKDWPVGLYQKGENVSIWVKTWAELIRECEARFDFVQEKLKVDVADKEIDERIAALKAAFKNIESHSDVDELDPEKLRQRSRPGHQVDATL